MNAHLFRRLAWKEYRVLRPIWISMFAIAVLMQLLVLWASCFPRHPHPKHACW